MGTTESLCLNRIEAFMGALADSQMKLVEGQKQLLTAQVILTDEVTKLAAAQKNTDARLDSLARKVETIGDNMNALIHVVDDLVRRPPQ